MDQEPRPLYGELVVASSCENQPRTSEVEVADGQTRSMIRETAYSLAEKKRICTWP